MLRAEVALVHTVDLCDFKILLLQCSGCFLVVRSKGLAVATPEIDTSAYMSRGVDGHNPPWSIEFNEDEIILDGSIKVVCGQDKDIRRHVRLGLFC